MENKMHLTILGLQAGSFFHRLCFNLREGVWLLINALIICYEKAASVTLDGREAINLFSSALLPYE